MTFATCGVTCSMLRWDLTFWSPERERAYWDHRFQHLKRADTAYIAVNIILYAIATVLYAANWEVPVWLAGCDCTLFMAWVVILCPDAFHRFRQHIVCATRLTNLAVHWLLLDQRDFGTIHSSDPLTDMSSKLIRGMGIIAYAWSNTFGLQLPFTQQVFILLIQLAASLSMVLGSGKVRLIPAAEAYQQVAHDVCGHMARALSPVSEAFAITTHEDLSQTCSSCPLLTITVLVPLFFGFVLPLYLVYIAEWKSKMDYVQCVVATPATEILVMGQYGRIPSLMLHAVILYILAFTSWSVTHIIVQAVAGAMPHLCMTQ